MATTLLHGETWDQAYARRFQEEADTDRAIERKLEWTLKRTEEILKDDDYCMSLLNQVHTDHPHLILNVARATFGNSISVLSALHLTLTRYARRMAESEASVRMWH